MSEQTTPLTTPPTSPPTADFSDPNGYDEQPQRTLRVGYLVMGLIFLGIAGIWALNASDTVDWGDSKYAFPAVLVGAGLLGLVGTVAINAIRRGDSRRASATHDATSATSEDTTDQAIDTTEDTTVLTTDEENDR